MENNAFVSSLKNLSVTALYDVLDDIKTRIADGMLSDNPAYTLVQASKAEAVRKEIESRNGVKQG